MNARRVSVFRKMPYRAGSVYAHEARAVISRRPLDFDQGDLDVAVTRHMTDLITTSQIHMSGEYIAVVVYGDQSCQCFTYVVGEVTNPSLRLVNE